ncbi:tryptophan 7-halogenase [Psychrosphaera sp. 1_MG-2023]|uniref:tryptophan halogenase family protein n=1 Tax=Psychrosphaera sp. 1_MG-2023 TaxID=3062643 RepID=UPI0026E21207|nr:tryptophan halogenase family protein [Psychrosphaera sp. 1_MG-2023]MDO6721388.1 tryptophan 7-halogenase [Psychrosphaera sp. 1_MG-2023]
MAKPFRIVILGGGTAGWMTANLMAKQWLSETAQTPPMEIVVVESPDIKTVGVGEGSTPTLQRFFNKMGISDPDWMAQCNATYKLNIRFSGWSPASGVDCYSHPFLSQLDTFTERPFAVNCLTRRLGLDVVTQPDKFLFNAYLAAHDKLPLVPEHFPFKMEYGYHFDAGLLGQFLMQHAIGLGVHHKLTTVKHVETSPNGDIKQLICNDGESIEGALFVDCTGFRSELLQQSLGVKFNSFKDNLFNDSAIVLPTMEISPKMETQSIAMSNGWRWQIPLTHRTGNGYVYSSQFQTADSAEHELRDALGLLDNDQVAGHLKMKVGQVSSHWEKNCIAIGLSQGFIEPLEATALHLVQISIESFMACFEQGEFRDTHKDEYNTLTTERFDRVRDYIVAHYKLNTRNDTDYWRANRDNNNLSEPLLQLLDVWFRNGDLGQEIARQKLNSHFGNMSWHCLLAGYGTFPALATKQPNTGDQFDEHQIEDFFQRCLLNFKTASLTS